MLSLADRDEARLVHMDWAKKSHQKSSACPHAWLDGILPYLMKNKKNMNLPWKGWQKKLPKIIGFLLINANGAIKYLLKTGVTAAESIIFIRSETFKLQASTGNEKDSKKLIKMNSFFIETTIFFRRTKIKMKIKNNELSHFFCFRRRLEPLSAQIPFGRCK